LFNAPIFPGLIIPNGVHFGGRGAPGNWSTTHLNCQAGENSEPDSRRTIGRLSPNGVPLYPVPPTPGSRPSEDGKKIWH